MKKSAEKRTTRQSYASSTFALFVLVATSVIVLFANLFLLLPQVSALSYNEHLLSQFTKGMEGEHLATETYPTVNGSEQFFIGTMRIGYIVITAGFIFGIVALLLALINKSLQSNDAPAYISLRFGQQANELQLAEEHRTIAQFSSEHSGALQTLELHPMDLQPSQQKPAEPLAKKSH